jgi:hypothetical protein
MLVPMVGSTAVHLVDKSVDERVAKREYESADS